MNHPRLSQHLGSDLTPSPTLYINERVATLWQAGETVYHLGFGESRFPVHPRMQQALAENAHRNSYLPGKGLPELRRAASLYYANQLGGDWGEEETLVAPGSKAILFGLMMALDGDLILPTPSWVSYAPQATMVGKEVLRIPADPTTFHRIEADALEETLARSSAEQHVLVLNSPNNPSSQIYSEAELERLTTLCRENNIWILSDELYALIVYSDSNRRSISRLCPERTIVLGGLSKHLSLGGWRLGIGLFPAHEGGRKLLAAVNKIGSEIWSCAPAPVQYAALTAFSADVEIEDYIGECARLHEMRTRYLWEQLEEMDIPCAQPEGGFYLFPNFDHHQEALAAINIHTSEDLALYLLETLKIATLPGTAFGTPPGELSLRLSASFIDLEEKEKAERLLQLSRQGIDPATMMGNEHPNMNEALRRMRGFLDSLYQV